LGDRADAGSLPPAAGPLVYSSTVPASNRPPGRARRALEVHALRADRLGAAL